MIHGLLPLLLLAAVRPLAAHDFRHPLTPTDLHRMDAALSTKAADAKWHDSIKNPSKLSRAYPDAFWHDLRQVKDRLPGGKGPVFGDLHVDNFEFVKARHGETVYGYGDFSNSGIGQVSADSLREFVNLRLAGASEREVKEAIAHYVDSLDAKEQPQGLPKQFDAPDWAELRKRRVTRLTDDGHQRFDFDNHKLGLSEAAAHVKLGVRALAAPGGPLEDFHIRDVGAFDRVQGSTGGYARYWALASRGGTPAILELDEAIRPAVTQLEGNKGQPTGDDRLTSMQQAFWGTVASHDYLSVQLDGKTFTVRDRLRMSLPDFDKLGDKDRQKIFDRQAELTAHVHAPGWEGVDHQAVEDWLEKSSQVVADRWTEAWKAARE